MIVKLNANKEDVPFGFTTSPNALDILTGEVSYFGEVKVSGVLKYMGEGYLAKGDIEVNKKFTCDRCLKETESFEKIPFEEKFTSYETDDSTLFTGDEIDLTDAVRDNILASEPIQKLCKEDCKGLCLICGHDLNEGDCGCDRRIPDPRMSVLDNLKI